MDGIELSNSTLSFHAIAISTSIVLTIIGVVFVPIIKWIHDVQSKCVEVEKKAAESYPTKHEVNESTTALELRWSQHAARLERRLDDLYRLHMPRAVVPAHRPEAEAHHPA